MRYRNRLKLQNLMKYPLPGECRLTLRLLLGSDISYQPNKDLSQGRNNLQLESYGYPIETGQFRITGTSRGKRLPTYCRVSLQAMIKRI